MKKNDLFLSLEIVKRFALGNVSEIMSDSKLKSVLGGYSGYHSGDCRQHSEGTCGWHAHGVTTPDCLCGISQSEVNNLLSLYGGNWCCDNCSTSSYCGGN